MSVSEAVSKPSQVIIDILKEMLERAESGSVQAIAIAGVTGNGESFNCFDGEVYPMSLIGELRVLEREVIDLCVDTRRKPAWEYCE